MLYLVATPIGNLGDITIRALDTLRAVDVVVCEDTSKTGLMLHHFEIKKPMISCNQRNERHAIERVISMLAEGRNVAVVVSLYPPESSRRLSPAINTTPYPPGPGLPIHAPSV